MSTPSDVLAHRAPTKQFLCPLSANPNIEFLSFVIQDYQTKKTIFEVSRDRPLPIDVSRHDASDPDSLRKINYELSEDFLRLPVVSTTLVFAVGQKPLENFRMIERHYFRNRLVKSFDFSFGFCIPGSTNTWEACYDLPPMDADLIDDMIKHPYETASDSFYFVGDKLVMHNKAYYKYTPEDANAQCKSYEAKYSQPSKRSSSSKPSAKAQAKTGTAKATAPGTAESKHSGAKSDSAAAKAESKLRSDPWSKESDYI